MIIGCDYSWRGSLQVGGGEFTSWKEIGAVGKVVRGV